MRLAQHSPPPSTYRRRRSLRHRLLGFILAAIAALGLIQVSTATPAQAAEKPNRIGTVLTHAYGQSRATIAMDECGDIGIGVIGSCVASTQHWLNLFNGAGLRIDGQFGPGTQRALINYQNARRLPPTGVVRAMERRAFAEDYNRIFGTRFPIVNGPGGKDFSLMSDWGTVRGTLYLSHGQSVLAARWLDENAGKGAAGAYIIEKFGCARIPHPGVKTACFAAAAAAAVSGLLLADMAKQVLNDPNGCFAVQYPPRGFPLVKASNPVFCQVS